MSIKRRQILRGSTPPQLLDGEFFQDTDTGDVSIGHNGSILPVSNTGSLQTQITALGNNKLDSSEVTATADPNKVVRRDTNGKIAGDILGNAATATKATQLSSSRTIAITGDATGSGTFNGSANLDIEVSVDPKKHMHTVSQIDGMPSLTGQGGKILKVKSDASGIETADESVDSYSKSQVDDFLSGKAEATHDHDGSYYTETEIDSKLSGKSDTGHTHGDLYYTETEIDAKMNDKSPVGHTHSGYAAESHTHDSSYAAPDHTHDSRYYTESEINSKLGEKASTTHNHDTSYYTKSQLDAYIGSMDSASGYAAAASVSANAAAASSNEAYGHRVAAAASAVTAATQAQTATTQAGLAKTYKDQILTLQAAVGNIDGGNSSSVYTAQQVINGGDSNG